MRLGTQQRLRLTGLSRKVSMREKTGTAQKLPHQDWESEKGQAADEEDEDEDEGPTEGAFKDKD